MFVSFLMWLWCPQNRNETGKFTLFREKNIILTNFIGGSYCVSHQHLFLLLRTGSIKQVYNWLHLDVIWTTWHLFIDTLMSSCERRGCLQGTNVNQVAEDISCISSSTVGGRIYSGENLLNKNINGHVWTKTSVRNHSDQ